MRPPVEKNLNNGRNVALPQDRQNRRRLDDLIQEWRYQKYVARQARLPRISGSAARPTLLGDFLRPRQHHRSIHIRSVPDPHTRKIRFAVAPARSRSCGRTLTAHLYQQRKIVAWSPQVSAPNELDIQFRWFPCLNSESLLLILRKRETDRRNGDVIGASRNSRDGEVSLGTAHALVNHSSGRVPGLHLSRGNCVAIWIGDVASDADSLR